MELGVKKTILAYLGLVGVLLIIGPLSTLRKVRALSGVRRGVSRRRAEMARGPESQATLALYLKRIAVRAAPLAILAIVLTACGGHGGGPAAPAPGVPVISNLAATFQGSCLSGATGTRLAITVNYSDSDGDVRGGTLETTARFEPSGQSNDLNFTLPSAGASITGTTEGTIQAFGCIRFSAQTAVNIAVALLDTAQNSSNVLSIRLDRPAGAPEVPHTSEAGGWGIERLRP